MVKNKKLYYPIYDKIRQGKKPITISKELNISKQNVNYYVSRLNKEGIIEKTNVSGFFKVLKTDLKEKDFESKKILSLGTGLKPITNLHAFQINFPILEGKVEDSDWNIKERLKNWIPKYKGLTNLGGLTIKNNNNKSLTVFAHSRNLKDLSEVHNLAFKIRAFVADYFKKKHNVILDVFNCQTKNLNLATQDKEAEEMISKGERFELDLNKIAEKIFKKDKMKGKAWIDGSPFKFSAETSDLEWKRNYLRMPFMTRDIMQATHYIAKNYASHVKLIEQASNVLEKLNKRLSTRKRKLKLSDSDQTTLGDFL